MVAERRAAGDRLAMVQQRARHSAHHHNMAVAREMSEAAERRQEEEEDRARATTVLGRPSQREHEYPLPSFATYEDTERRRRLETSNHGGASASTNGARTPCASNDGAGTSGAGNFGSYY
jgi:hypothetical protein